VILEGILYSIRWRNFLPGTSFFIPCLNCKAVRAELLELLKEEKRLPVVTKIVLEDGIRGLRVWKT
jgi:hypothetical protein